MNKLLSYAGSFWRKGSPSPADELASQEQTRRPDTTGLSLVSERNVCALDKAPDLTAAQDCATPDARRRALIQHRTISKAGHGQGETCPDPCQQHDAQLNARMLDHLCTKAPVTDPELLVHMIRRRFPFENWPDLIGVSDPQLGEALLEQGPRTIALAATSLPGERLEALMVDSRLARGFVRQSPYLFSLLPEALKTAPFLASLLSGQLEANRRSLLRDLLREDVQLALSLASVEELVRINPHCVLELPEQEVTPELRQIAVSRDASLLEHFRKTVPEGEYQELCERALVLSGGALKYMPACERTPARVDRAVAHKFPPRMAEIPELLRTRERLRLALHNSTHSQYCLKRNKLSAAFVTEHNLWGTLKEKDRWLHYIRTEDQTDALWCEYINQCPVRVWEHEVPPALRERHPEWTAGVWKPDCAMSLSDQTGLLCRGLAGWSGAQLAPVLEYNSAFLHGQFCWPPIQDMPPWALLVEGFQDQLPQQYKDMIWRNGGTEGLGPALGAPAFDVEPEALLDPVQESHCTLRAARVPSQVASKLMFCEHFQPRHQRLGQQLRHRMIAGGQALEQSVAAGTLPLWSEDRPPAAGSWTARGGRTLVRGDSKDGVVHMKFQRQGESLASLAAEQAVQQFARDHKELGWQSEIPVPKGMVRVPLDQMPLAPEAFPDRLQVYGEGDNRYCLAFCFTTKDSDYDTLAWQPDEAGGDCSKAREGLLRAFHDLGIWSSFGAVHTSTIKLYHHFFATEGARPELLLSQLFRPGQSYPGTLHRWNTLAIEQSDWGRSGLRDLGDLEFYPCISTYVEAVDADWVPDGYGQRASIVNAMAQNVLGGLLHYMSAHRQLPDYHYQNAGQVKQLAGFLDEACNAYLGTLLGDGTRLEEAFPEGVYQQWLHKTAQEMIYWSARTNRDAGRRQGGLCPAF